MGLSYVPTTDADELRRRLELIMAPGPPVDYDLERRLVRLDGLFRNYAVTCPAPLWAPGLVLTHEIINQTERYLPLAEIARAFCRFARLAMNAPDAADIPLFHDAAGWLPFLERMGWPTADANPARLLTALLDDRELRCRLLFALHLPKQHGGDFTRYPEQLRTLGKWLRIRSGRGILSCLDAACGTGEGTWDLAGALLASGFPPDAVSVEGLTLGTLELFAAAHAFFPHDPGRQQAYRARIAPLLAAGTGDRLLFSRADLRGGSDSGKAYGAILCNGLLGGPMLHDRGIVERVVRRLAASLEPGGILMVADRFHAGWHKVFPRRQLEELLVGCGLRLVDGGEGIAGVRT